MKTTPARSFWSNVLEKFHRLKRKPAILITGCAGMIGSKLADWLVLNHPEYEIVGIDDLSGGYLEFVNPKCVFYLRDASTNLNDIFERHDIKIIYHFCAEAAESVANFKRKFYYHSNVVCSANLINYAITYNVDRFVFASSMAVYGNNPTPFIETQTPAPIDCYGIGKYAVEMDLKCAKDQHGLKYTIIRPHSVYGPNQNLWDKYRNITAIFMRKILNGEPVTIYGDGLQRRAFTNIDDLMEPMWLCAISEKTLYETFNLGSDSEMTLLEMLEILEEVVGFKPERKYYPAIHEVQNAFSDHTKAKTILGLECKTSLREGLERMWNWAKDQPKRPLQTFDKFELEVGLYEQFK